MARAIFITDSTQIWLLLWIGNGDSQSLSDYGSDSQNRKLWFCSTQVHPFKTG
jgi:hypothetical protein